MDGMAPSSTFLRLTPTLHSSSPIWWRPSDLVPSMESWKWNLTRRSIFSKITMRSFSAGLVHTASFDFYCYSLTFWAVWNVGYPRVYILAWMRAFAWTPAQKEQEGMGESTVSPMNQLCSGAVGQVKHGERWLQVAAQTCRRNPQRSWRTHV